MLSTMLTAATPVSPAKRIAIILKKNVAIPAEDSLTISDEPLRKQCPMYFQSTVNFLNESFVSLNMKYAPPASITVTSPATFAYAAPLSPISRGPIRT